MSRREPHGAPSEPDAREIIVCPRWLVRAVIGLAILSALCITGLAVGAVYLHQQQQYIEGRGEVRDQENAELNQRIDDAVQEGKCDLLDQLPAGGFLDRLRGTFDCGPGIPLDQLPPEIRQRFEGTPAPSRPAESSTVPLAPPLGSAAVPGVERPTPNSPSSGHGLPPESSPAPASPSPLVDLGPVTEQVCDALGICV